LKSPLPLTPLPRIAGLVLSKRLEMRLIPASLFVSAFLLQDAFGQSMPLTLTGVTKGLTVNQQSSHQPL
jgi:hypothetical protein